MSKKDPGGPAFPVHPDMAERLGCFNSQSDAGMSIRDYFAIRAFQARLAKYDDWTLTEIAQQAYSDADAMLEARK